jgi:hypothetical protein
MLQEFLNLNFIQITEDSNVEKLKKAATEIAKKIIKNKTKISAYVLIALDPEISADNPDVKEVREIIISHWSTFVANTKDIPVTYIRAVILEALEIISKEAEEACLIWFAGRNVIKYYKLGREKEILANFLLAVGNKIETEVAENWSFSHDEEIPIPVVTVAAIDKGEIESILKAAAIQNSVGGENAYWPSQNDANWATFFSTRAGKGLTDAINKTLKKQVAEISSNQSEFIQHNSLLQMRTQLLWWKEAGYSSSLRKSYRDLEDGILQIILANDYSNFIPELYPSSVDYFLRETHNSLSPEGNKKIKISEFLKLVEPSKMDVQKFLSDSIDNGGRISFYSFLNGLVWGRFDAKQFKNLVGISDSTELTYADITQWLFNDLHVVKISNN